MKIVHMMAGLSEASGVANIARRFARVQREQGNEVELLAPESKRNPIYFSWEFAQQAKAMACAADEIWVHCSWTFPVWFGTYLARHYKKRLIVVPEASFDPLRLHNHASWKKRLVSWLDRWVIRKADEVLALCPDEVDWVRAFEPRAKVRFERVPTFYNKTRMQRCASLHKPMHVLFLGRAEDPLKGVKYLQEAVDETMSLRVESNLFGKEKEAAWDWCDVFCLPTLSDNFGLVVAEALEHSKRVITTDGASVWEHENRVTYLKGFRDSTDAERVKMLREALRRQT